MNLKNDICWSRLKQKFANIIDQFSTEANSVNSDQTVPIGAVWSGSTLFEQGF